MYRAEVGESGSLASAAPEDKIGKQRIGKISYFQKQTVPFKSWELWCSEYFKITLKVLEILK